MKKKLLILLVLLVLISGCKKTRKPVEEPEVEPDVKITNRYYYSSEEVQVDPEHPKYTETEVRRLVLISDGTFYYEYGTSCKEVGYGTYTETEEEIVLNETKIYSCNSCYFDSTDVSTYTKEGNTLKWQTLTLELQENEYDLSLIERNDEMNCRDVN